MKISPGIPNRRAGPAAALRRVPLQALPDLWGRDLHHVQEQRGGDREPKALEQSAGKLVRNNLKGWDIPRTTRDFLDDQSAKTAIGFAVALVILVIGTGIPVIPEPLRTEQSKLEAFDKHDPGVGMNRRAHPSKPLAPAPAAPATDGLAAGRSTMVMDVARSFVGKHEVEHAAAIGAFIVRMTGHKLDVRETPWCAAFVNAVLRASGFDGTKSLQARSFLEFGTETQVPRPGDIAVFSRGDPNGRAGHVGFYVSEIKRNEQIYILIVGGNQMDAVSERLYPKSQLLGYRRPPAVNVTQRA